MAQDVGTVYVQVSPSGKGFSKSIEGDISTGAVSGSKKASHTVMGKVGGAFKKVGKIGVTAVGAVAAGVVGLAAKGGFERALNIENAQAKLKGLGHDSKSVAGIMDDALKSVKGTAFGLGDAATVAASLSASGVKQGKQLEKTLKTVADTAQISGRSLTDIGTIFGSVAARGKLQGDDMLQLMSSGVPVLQLLGKHLGKTSAEVSDMVSEGKIDFQTFADSMQEGLGGAALKAGDTFSGALANVKAALSRLGEKVAGPVLNGLRDLFNQAIPLFDDFGEKVGPVLDDIGKKIGTSLSNAIPNIQNALSTIREGFEKSGIPDAVHNAFGGLDFSGLANSGKQAFESLSKGAKNALDGLTPLIVSVIGFAGDMTQSFSDMFATILPSLGDFGENIGNLAGKISEGFAPFIDEIGPYIQDFIDSISQGIKKFFDNLNPHLKKFVDDAVPKIMDFIEWLGDIGGPILQHIGDIVMPILSMIGDVLGGLIDILTGIIEYLHGVFTGDWDEAWTGIKDIFGGAWTAISGVFEGVWETIKGVFGLADTDIGQEWRDLWDNISSFFSEKWTGIKDSISNGWNSITGLFSTKGNDTANSWNSTWSRIGSTLSSAWGSIKSGVSSGVQNVVDSVRSIQGRIQGIFSNAGNWLYNSGKSILEGFWNGINSTIGLVKSKISGALGSIRKLFPFSPAKEGPFSGHGYTTYSGAALMSGFGQGAVGAAQATASKIARSLQLTQSLFDDFTYGTSSIGANTRRYSASFANAGTASGSNGVVQNINITNKGVVNPYVNGNIIGRTVASSARASLMGV